MKLTTIEYGTPEYEELVELRQSVLRRVLGYPITADEIAKEKDDIYVAGTNEAGDIIACCILTELEKLPTHTIQLRQMAVATAEQKKGLGEELLRYAESIAKANGFDTIYLHARKYAMAFYAKLGYEIVGDEFLELEIPHYIMTRKI